MFFNQDEENNFLSDKRVEEMEDFLSDDRVQEVSQEEARPRRRGGYMAQDEPPKKQEIKREIRPQKVEEDDDEADDTAVNIAIVIVLIIVLILAGLLISKILFTKAGNKEENTPKTEQVTPKTETKTETKTENNQENKTDNKTQNTSADTLSSSDTYDAYALKFESVVYKKGGNFYNNTEKIKGDKVYVEYKQISGLKDTTKQAEINKMLMDKVTALYDKNYLADKDILFVDIHTKISVNFNTLSYVIYRTGEDINGKHILQKVESINIRLKDKSNISFEDIFTQNATITNVYKDYVKGKVSAYYYTPSKLYVYDSNYKETVIDMSTYASSISIFTKYKADTDLFTSTAKSQKAFTILDSTVSEETKDRAFVQN